MFSTALGFLSKLLHSAVCLGLSHSPESPRKATGVSLLVYLTIRREPTVSGPISLRVKLPALSA